jgi:hypothetical protein
MRRITLNLEELNVESFAVLPNADQPEGTVRAYQTGPSCPEGTCFGPSCEETCGHTCPNTCDWTCDDPSCQPETGCGSGPCRCSPTMIC